MVSKMQRRRFNFLIGTRGDVRGWKCDNVVYSKGLDEFTMVVLWKEPERILRGFPIV